MTDDTRRERFLRLVKQLGAGDWLQARSWAELVLAEWGEAGRHYHNLRHLDECLAEFDRARVLIKRPELVETALWFHDVVYNARAADNEARSAALAVEFLRGAGVSAADATQVERLILATHTHTADGNADTEFMLDIDLAILGQPASCFDDYENAIRQEYSHVPQAEFATKRAEILKRFLQRPRLFITEDFYTRYEEEARTNLERSIERLAFQVA